MPFRGIYFPYYIDQARLLDIYAALNNGYAEYKELENTVSVKSEKHAKGSMSVGFKMLKLGAQGEGSFGSGSESLGISRERMVQTTASMLGLVVDQLKDEGFIKSIKQAKCGDMVIVPVNLAVNSIKSVIDESEGLVKLSKEMQALNSAKRSTSGDDTLKNIKKIASVAHQLFDAEELLSVGDEFAVFGNVSDDHLYQSSRSGIIGIDLDCLAVVRGIFPEGTQLMKNTVFSRFKGKDIKQPLIDSVKKLADQDGYSCEATAVTEITDMPVYELQIIALFQSLNSGSRGSEGDDGHGSVAN